MATDPLIGAFAVPPHLCGEPPLMRTPTERGLVLRAYCQAMGLDMDEWPDEALLVHLDEWRRLMGLDSPQQFGCSVTLWGSVRDWFGYWSWRLGR